SCWTAAPRHRTDKRVGRAGAVCLPGAAPAAEDQAQGEEAMKWVRDNTQRFERRPFYEQAELDVEAERLVTEFSSHFYGQMLVPIPTGALTKLIERDADTLDLYADLTSEGEGVEAVTYFAPKFKPK